MQLGTKCVHQWFGISVTLNTVNTHGTTKNQPIPISFTTYPKVAVSSPDIGDVGYFRWNGICAPNDANAYFVCNSNGYNYPQSRIVHFIAVGY